MEITDTKAKSLYCKWLVKDGDNYVEDFFPSKSNPVVISDWSLQVEIMGAAPAITASFMHRQCLDDLWIDDVYVYLNGDKYRLKQRPLSSKANDDVRYKYEVTFLSERSKLENILMLDVYTGLGDINGDYANRYRTNSTEFSFYGDVDELICRINECINNAGFYSEDDGFIVVKGSESISSETKEVSISNISVLAAIQMIYTTFGLPFWWDGNKCVVGEPGIFNEWVLQYGQDEAILDISRSIANEDIKTSLTGIGGSENIPYYYPNLSPDRDSDENGGVWIPTSASLMPSIYRSSKGKDRFYNAVNGAYEAFPLFDNQYDPQRPKQGFSEFSDIKPTIEGVTNSLGQAIGTIAGVAYDDDDNDNLNGEQYEHPYFYIKLRVFDGDFGFNLFEQGIENGEMTINMTSGNCAGCSFPVGVSSPKQVDGKYVFENPVQLDQFGKIVAGNYNDKIVFSNIQPQQQDTSKNGVWIALTKDNNTFGVVMPNATNNYKPAVGDTFVITNINLPQKYIEAAEKKLDEAIVEQLYNSNRNSINYSVKLSRIYCNRHTTMISWIASGGRVKLWYNGEEHHLFVKSYTIKNDENVLQEYSIELSEELSIAGNSIEAKIADAIGDFSKVVKEDIVGKLSSEYLSKRRSDTALGRITFGGGITSNAETILKEVATVGNFQKDTQVGIGAKEGVRMLPNGTIVARSLELSEYLNVPSIKYNSIEVLSGTRWDSAGKGRIKHIVSTDDENKTCGFILDLSEGEPGEFLVDDILRGFWHSNDNSANSTVNNDDRKGNISRAGFQSIYCRVVNVQNVIEREDGDNTIYILKDDNYSAKDGDKEFVNGFVTVSMRQFDDGSYSPYPSQNSVLSVSGSFSSLYPERKNFFIYTTSYTARYEGVNNWEWEDKNLMGAWGNLDGFSMLYESEDGTVYKREHSGEGFITKNAHVYGVLEQFTRFSDKIEVVLSHPNGTIEAGISIRADFILKNVEGETISSGYKLNISRQSGDNESDASWNNAVVEKYPYGIPPALYFTVDDVPENGAVFVVSAVRKVGDVEYSTSSAFTLSRLQSAEILSLVLSLSPSINSDGTIAEGETARLEANVYNDKNALISGCSYTITRETDDSEADASWNETHSFTDNYILLTTSDLGIDNASFIVVAYVSEGGVLYRNIVGRITISRVSKQELNILLPNASAITPFDEVDVRLSPKLMSGNNDITFKTLDTDWSWVINTGNSEFDAAWNEEHKEGRLLNITNSDLPVGWENISPVQFEVLCNYRGSEVRAITDSTRAYKRFRVGETFSIELNVTMQGDDFTDADFYIQVVDARGLAERWDFTRNNNVFTLDFQGTKTESMILGKYRVSLWYKKGEPNQSVLDFYPAFELVAITEEV